MKPPADLRCIGPAHQDAGAPPAPPPILCVVGPDPPARLHRDCGRPVQESVARQETRSERALCEAALGGDMSAWNVLVERHTHRVVVSLLARGVLIDRAKDIAQDAWLRLVEQQRQGKLARLELPGLAITQAAFLAIEAVRREMSARRHEAHADRDAVAGVADPRANAEGRLLAEERFARAEAILASRSASARRVFQLVYGPEGLSHADVAQRLGLSLQRVRQIVCEVRKELRAAVEGD